MGSSSALSSANVISIVGAVCGSIVVTELFLWMRNDTLLRCNLPKNGRKLLYKFGGKN